MTKRINETNEEYNKRRREIYQRDIEKMHKWQREYAKKNKEKLRKAKNKWYHKNKNIKPYLQWKNKKDNPVVLKHRTPEARHTQYERRKEMGTVKLPTAEKRTEHKNAKAQRKQEIRKTIAEAWKKEIVCFCCGIGENEKALIDIEHRLPRIVLKERFPYLRLEMKSLTFEEYMSVYLECPRSTNLKEFKKLTKLEIRRHFALLCRQCNLEVWNFGRCRITDKKRKHKHWKKSSKWLDKTYGVKEYMRTWKDWYNEKQIKKKSRG